MDAIPWISRERESRREEEALPNII